MAQDRGPVAEALHLFQPVRNIKHRAALACQKPQGEKKQVRLLRRQNRRRLIKDQQLGFLHQAAQDFNALALAHRQVRHRCPGVQRQAIFLGIKLHFLGKRREIEFSGHCQGNVFDDSQGFKQ